MSKNGSDIKAGQYWVARYNGDNGDLILGCVQSVRVNGKILLDNLLNGKTATKNAGVLRRRNKRITKKTADLLLEQWNRQRVKSALRKAAVEASEVGVKQTKVAKQKMNYAARCYDADQKKRKEVGWCGSAWVGVNFQMPKTVLEKNALEYIKKRFPNSINVHVYDLVEMAMDLQKGVGK